MMDDERRICVIVGMKVNLGNRESADASLCLSNIHVGASEAEIDEMLDTSKVAFSRIKGRLLAKCDALRAKE